MCVCVLGGVISLCRSMCLFLSGQLSFAIRLLQLSVGLAVALHSLSVSFSVARVIGCSPTPRCRGCALVVCCTVRTVCTKVALRVRVRRCLRVAFSRPSTPHHIHSSHTTPRNIHTPHTPHTTHTNHFHYHPLPLILVHTSLGWCTVYCMPRMHCLCLIKSTQYFQSCEHPSQV